MGRSALGRSIPLLWEVKQGGRTQKYIKPGNNHGEKDWWVPHPRTGIYYPKGFEWVMEDVPEGASSFKDKYWLRSTEGAEKPTSDASASDIFNHPYLKA